MLSLNKQFWRLYVIVFLTIVALLIGISTLYDEIVEQDNYQVLLTQIFSTPEMSPVLETIAPGEIHFPAELQQKLLSGDVLALRTGQEALTYYRMQDGQLYAFGPVSDRPDKQTTDSRYLAAAYYVLIALALLVLLYPLTRDILTMRRASHAFTSRPQPLNLKISSSSLLFPLATSMNQMSARIAELLKLQQDLANTVAHEVRTPLARMTFVVEKVSASLDDQSYRRLIRDIDEISQLVSDYLEFVRAQHDELLRELRWQSPKNLIQDIKDKFSQHPANIQLSVQFDDNAGYFDARFMQIALQNLLVNAYRYAHRQIEVHWRITADICEICVEDDGDGLQGKTEALKQAFKREAKNSQDIGFGLGLYIAHQIAQRHRGELIISDSIKLGGALFCIQWPNSEPEQKADKYAVGQ